MATYPQVPAGVRVKEGAFVSPEAVFAAAQLTGAPWALLAAVVENESHFRWAAHSSADARGAAQVLHGPTDAWQNIVAGARILVDYIARFGGNVRLGVAAYNAGPGNVQAAGGVPSYTRTYVDAVIEDATRFAQLGQARTAAQIRTLDNFPTRFASSSAAATDPTYVQISASADRPGHPTAPGVLAFVNAVGALVGKTLTIGTGTNHNEFVADSNPPRQSDHWIGHAADIPTSSEAENIAIGQAALITAGMPEAVARRQTGGLYNVNGAQIIFNAKGQAVGGDHTNHVHIGLTNPASWIDKLGGIITGLGGLPGAGGFGGLGDLLGLQDFTLRVLGLDQIADFFRSIGDLFRDPLRLLEIVAGLGLTVIGILVLTRWVTSSTPSLAGGTTSVGALRVTTPAMALR